MTVPSGAMRRRGTFDKTEPRDFVRDDGPGGVRGSWPEGPFVTTFPAGSGSDLSELDKAIALNVIKALAADTQDWRRWRRANRLTIKAAARRAGVSAARIGDLENGRRFPAFDLMYRLKLLMAAQSPTPR